MSHDTGHRPTAFADRPTLRLLSLGLGGPSRPVARVLARLSEIDGAEWFRSALHRLPLDKADPEAFFVRGGASASELEAVKARCKRLASTSDESMLLGALGYLLAVAAAACHNGSVISSRPQPEIESALLDLAQVLPAPWQDMLARAALLLSGDAG